MDYFFDFSFAFFFFFLSMMFFRIFFSYFGYKRNIADGAFIGAVMYMIFKFFSDFSNVDKVFFDIFGFFCAYMVFKFKIEK